MLKKILFGLRHLDAIWQIVSDALALAKKYEAEVGADEKTAEAAALDAVKKSTHENATAAEIARRDSWMHNRPDGGG